MNRWRLPFLLVLCGLAGSLSASQSIRKASSFILMVVPETDTTMTGSPVYRLSASTNPGRSVSINGKPYKVYPSGAFAGLLELSVGENSYVINSVGAAGDTITKTLLVVRSKPLETTPVDSLVIEDVLMEPSSDMWLNEGDIMQVQLKGTPNCKASFLNGLPLREVPAAERGGLGGIYRGTYKVSANDTLTSQPLMFRLEDSAGHGITSRTKAKISFKPREFPLVGITKGDRPALSFGLGEDRLGGAKLSFVNPGIRLAITGKVGDMYRVALAESQEAWIDEDQLDLQPSGTFLPFSLTGNLSVYGNDKADYVTIGMSDRLPYSSDQELDPTRLNVNVYGAVSNTNWIIQQNSAKEVRNVYYKQTGKNVFRVTIELKHKQMWGYEIGYTGTNLVIKIRRQPERLKIKALTFALDAGHGGSNNGAPGSTGAKEKDVNLATVFHLKRLLERDGARVVLTRSDDTGTMNSERLRRVLSSGADILISIHSNSIGLTTNPEDTKGLSTFYKYMCYRPLSTCILESVLKTGLPRWGNVGSFNFTLNSPTELPNVLVELAFMSNPEDEMKLLDDEFREEIAEKIKDGIEDFLDYCDD